MTRRLFVGVLASLCAILGSATVSPMVARAGDPIPDIDIVDPAGQYDYGQAIVTHQQVPSRDALGTLIWVDIIRPKQNGSEKFPTIMDASPYFNTLGRGYKSERKTFADPAIAWPDPNVFGGGPRVPFPEWLDEFFVPRGYAIALMDLRGTRNSQGCEVYGGGDEGRDAVDVIDWIATQSWSNGKVGMIGGSYDGTNANSAAADAGLRNDDHLAAIVPIRAIDRWYDYQFYNGAQSGYTQLDPPEFTGAFPAVDNPDYDPTDPTYAATFNERKACIATLGAATTAQYAPPYQDTSLPFWTDRNFLKSAPTWKAATFFIHGLFDFNVVNNNTGQLWQALNAVAPNVPHKLWWMNAQHADPDGPSWDQGGGRSGDYLPFAFQQKFETEVHRWFAQYLKGIAAGADLTPRVEVQRDDGHWDTYNSYPAGTDQVLHFSPTLVSGSQTTHRLTAAPSPAGTVAWDDGGFQAAGSQVFETDPYVEDTRITGQFEFDLSLATTGTDTTVGVLVEDVTPAGDGSTCAINNSVAIYHDNGSKAVDPCNGKFEFGLAFIRAWYRGDIHPRGASDPTVGAPMTPNTQTVMSFPSFYTDFIVHPGHKLRFTLANDADGHLVTTDQGGTVTMAMGAANGLSQVRIPTAPIIEAPNPNVPEFPAGAWIAPMVAAAALVVMGRRRRGAAQN